MAEILDWEETRKRREEWKAWGERVVFTNGCFDLLHAGHVHLLEQAKGLGKRLIVALNSDESVHRLKGAGRPLIPQEERAEVVAGLACVDVVTVFDQDNPLEIIKLLEPDVLVKGGDWAVENIIGADVVKKRKGEVVVIPLVEGKGTTAMVKAARESWRRKGGASEGESTESENG